MDVGGSDRDGEELMLLQETGVGGTELPDGDLGSGEELGGRDNKLFWGGETFRGIAFLVKYHSAFFCVLVRAFNS